MKTKAQSKENEVSVEEAIKMGSRFVNYPSMAIFVSLMIPGFIISYLADDDKVLLWFMLAGIGLGMGYWSIAVTKWRIWAFLNVRNVHDLQTRARDRSIISEEGGFTEKLEYRSKQDKETWNKLQEKFKKKDVFEKPKNYPEVTEIGISRPVAIFYFLLYLFVVGVISFVIYENGINWITGIGLLVMLWMLKGYVYKLFIQKTQITLSKKGIETNEHPLCKWKEVRDMEIKKRMSNNSYKFYFEYSTPSTVMSICLEDLHVGVDNFREAIWVYSNKRCK